MKRLAESTTEYSFTTIPWSLIIPSLIILALALLVNFIIYYEIKEEY